MWCNALLMANFSIYRMAKIFDNLFCSWLDAVGSANFEIFEFYYINQHIFRKISNWKYLAEHKLKRSEGPCSKIPADWLKKINVICKPECTKWTIGYLEI